MAKNSLSDLYNNSRTTREISMRDEFENTLDGTTKEISKKQQGLIRRMRRDSNGDRILCGCVDSVTKEPEKDRFCPTCLGEGYLWDEVNITFYKALQSHRVVTIEPGLIKIPLMVFYFRYSITIDDQDKIIQLVLDSEGKPVTPVRRESVWKIHNIETLRLDTGRIEFLKIDAFREDVKHLNVE